LEIEKYLQAKEAIQILTTAMSRLIDAALFPGDGKKRKRKQKSKRS
jgi:hypothetical protein